MSHALEISVPIQPDKDNKVNAILAYVDYDKARGGIYLGLMGVKLKDEGQFRSMSFVMFDPIHKAKYIVLEPATRLSRKMVELHCRDVKREVEERLGVHWAKVKDFANERGFIILEPVAVEIPA